MKRFLLSLFAIAVAILANARTDVDFSSKFEEGTNTIYCPSAWGWHSVNLGSTFEVQEAEYLYISYESSCNFSFILQDPGWQNAYVVNCSSQDTEGYIKLEPGAYDYYSCVVIQNHSEGSIVINKVYFCTEEEFYNPAPDDIDGARANLIDIYLRYQKYTDKFPLGDGYGQYPAELYEKFVAALEAALVMDNEEEMQKLSVEELNALSQAIVDAYRELTAAKKMYLPADGYYRFICARQFYEGSEDSGFTYPIKGMYSENNGTNGWKTVDATDPTFLWTLERQEDDTYLLRNAANKLNFTSTDRCEGSEKFITFDAINKVDGTYQTIWPLNTEEDIVMFNFRFKDEAANDYRYIHMNWHNEGSGWGGPLTVWCNTTNDSGASEWYLEPVDKSIAEEILGTNYGYRFSILLADAEEKIEIAEDTKRVKLITDSNQFSSPYSQNDLGSSDGGNLNAGVLIDGSTSTYWHSVWSNGSVALGEHYLQIELLENISGNVELKFSRRNTSSDHVTMWGIYGSNYSSGEKYDYEWIDDIEVPYGQPAETITCNFTIEEGKQYEYLRFYAENSTGGNGFFHISEFQLYSLSDNENSQAIQMGDIYANLKSAVDKAKGLDPNNISKEQYDELKSVYDAFMAVFVNPNPLREAIESVEPLLALCEIGDNPGEWSQETVDAYMNRLQAAKDYDEAGKYTQEEIDQYITQLTGDGFNFLALANKVSPDKYYAIRFASEDMYEDHQWSTSNVLSEDWGNLFNTYLSPADSETLKAFPSDELRQGSGVFFIDDDKGDILFRFISIGDDKYIIQHQASGLFIHCYGRDSWTALNLVPSIFTVEAVGYGENIIRGVDYEGNDLTCLHAALNGHRLVTWHDDYVGCNSGLIIEEIGDVASYGEAGQSLIDYMPGELTTMCYPVALTPNEGKMLKVAGTFQVDEKLYVALNEVSKAEAGEPVIFLNDGSYDAEAAAVPVSFTAGTEIIQQPKNDTPLQGTYSDVELSESAILFSGNACELSTEENNTVYANHAYLPVGAQEVDASGSYSLVLEVGGDFDSIGQVLSSISTSGSVHTVSGQLVRQQATLGDVLRLPRGIYIFNGKKIWVR